MAKHSLKGAGFQSVVADLQKLRDSGRISSDELETRLDADDIALLDQKINPAAWYDIDAYSRFMEILIEHDGGSDPNAYLEGRGAAMCQRLIEAGTYGQLNMVERMDDARRRERMVQDVRLMATMYSAMLNFATLQVREDPELGLCLEISDAAGFPAPLLTVITGVMTYLANRMTPGSGHYVSEYIADDLIRYHRIAP